ncbi:hypothetical protein B5S31_g2485 [[Candida] boidinii]|nr:hypothetical protein B5S31_g2485 [[Candida] boidinii]
MCDIKRTLDVGGNCILEMPSGTGKTVSLLSLTVAYQMFYPEHRKIIYCSRTMSEIEKALIELQKLMDYRAGELGYVEDFRGLGLTSRKNLCLHPIASRERKGIVVDETCRRMTNGQLKEKIEREEASVEDLCSFHEKLYEKDPHNLIPPGVYSFDSLIKYCKKEGTCPYFTVRRMMPFCNIIIYSYHYLLDPKIGERVSKELSKDSIVIFDEAHNIDNVCIESLSLDLTDDILKRASKGANSLSRKIDEVKQHDSKRLQDEYEKLVEGLRESGISQGEETFMANPVLSEDVLDEAVPGSIRRAEHFISFLKRFIEYLKTRMKVLHVVSETPTSFLQHLKHLTFIEKKPLRFCSERLSLLVRTLEVAEIEEFTALKDIATFATLVSTYESGFQLILEPYETENATVPNPILKFTCLDASIAMKPVFERFSSIIITSGTISPLDMYPRMLNFETVVQESYTMTLAKRSFLPMVVTKGSDQVAISSRFEIRNDPSIVRNYGTLLIEFSKITPDGLVVFFPSYLYMESIISMWQTMGILDEVWKYKLILVETPDAQETALALETYRKACSNGRGAVLLSVARGKVSEGIDFDHHYGRTVLMIGIPFQYTESRILKARLEFLRDHYQIRENDFLSFDAMRHAAQCLGRVLRGKDDYGVMVMADRRFARKKNQLPKWIAQGLLDSDINLSTDMAIASAKKFLRTLAQPTDPKDQEGLSVWNIDQLIAFQKEQSRSYKNDLDEMDNMDIDEDEIRELNENLSSKADKEVIHKEIVISEVVSPMVEDVVQKLPSNSPKVPELEEPFKEDIEPQEQKDDNKGEPEGDAIQNVQEAQDKTEDIQEIPAKSPILQDKKLHDQVVELNDDDDDDDDDEQLEPAVSYRSQKVVVEDDDEDEDEDDYDEDDDLSAPKSSIKTQAIVLDDDDDDDDLSGPKGASKSQMIPLDDDEDDDVGIAVSRRAKTIVMDEDDDDAVMDLEPSNNGAFDEDDDEDFNVPAVNKRKAAVAIDDDEDEEMI